MIGEEAPLEMLTSLLFAAALALAPQAAPQPATQPAGLAAGDRAPNFELRCSDGKLHKLSDLKGKTVVIAWFPKAFTGG